MHEQYQRSLDECGENLRAKMVAAELSHREKLKDRARANPYRSSWGQSAWSQVWTLFWVCALFYFVLSSDWLFSEQGLIFVLCGISFGLLSSHRAMHKRMDAIVELMEYDRKRDQHG